MQAREGRDTGVECGLTFKNIYLFIFMHSVASLLSVCHHVNVYI